MTRRNGAGATRKSARRYSDLWNVEDKLAFVLGAQKSTWSDALQYAGQAVDSGEKLVDADPSVSNRRKLEGSVAALARIQNLVGLTQDALNGYVRYVALVRERATAEPSSENAAALGIAYAQLAAFEAHHGNKSAAPADYQSALDWLAKAGSKDISVEREIATTNLRLADVESGFGQADQARQHYLQAVRASERCLALDRGTSAQIGLVTDYQSLAFGKLGSGDRKGAAEALERLLEAGQSRCGCGAKFHDQRTGRPRRSAVPQCLRDPGMGGAAQRLICPSPSRHPRPRCIWMISKPGSTRISPTRT